MRKVICQSGNFNLTVGEVGFTPFLLAGIDGIYGSSNDLTISKNAMTNGGTFQGTTANIREIVLRLIVEPNHKWRQDVRDYLYSLFSKDSYGKLTYIENEDERYIHYRVESVMQSEWQKRLFEVTLLCEDPYFYSVKEEKIVLASFTGCFEFVHEFQFDGEEFGYKSNSTIATINNTSGVDGIGITITVLFTGDTINPKFTKIETGQSIQLGTELYPLMCQYHDLLTITTGQSDKHVYLQRGGVTTEINQYLSEDSEFIQLSRGVNSIGFSADEGSDYMEVEIGYRMQYEGA